MYKNRINHNKGGRKPRGGKKAGGYRTIGQPLQRLYLEKSAFKPLPREIEFALPYYYHDERTGGQTTQASRRFPLCEFDTTIPRYAAELYQIYRHARIMAIDVHMSVVNTSSTEPLLVAVGVLPLANVSAITSPQQIISIPGSVMKQVGLSTGMSRTTITKRYVTEKCLGELTLGSNTYLQTYSEALSSAIWTELPAVYTGIIAARNGATWTGIIDYRVTYHLRFSELNVPSLGEESGYEQMVPPNKEYQKKLENKGKNIRPDYIEDDDADDEDQLDKEWVRPDPTLPADFRRKHSSSTSVGSKGLANRTANGQLDRSSIQNHR